MNLIRRDFLSGASATAMWTSPAFGAFFRTSSPTPAPPASIQGIVLSQYNFTSGNLAPFATITVNLTDGVFSGSLALGGTDAASFQLNSTANSNQWTIQPAPGTASGTYSVTFTATGSYPNSPQTSPTFPTFTGTLTGSEPGTLTTMALVNTTGSLQAANFNTPFKREIFVQGDVPAKAVYTASRLTNILTVLSVSSGTLSVGDLVISDFVGSPKASVGPWCYITAQLSGAGGGVGTYRVSNTGTVASTTMWSSGCPAFKIAGVAQPFSWGLMDYWPDHSLRIASFWFLCGNCVAGNGKLTVDISGNGTTPQTSARTLTEVYAQNLQVNAVGKIGLSGTWTGVLASNALNVQQLVYMDGDAGKCWRILTHMAQSGVAHGQLECEHYVTALTNSSGNLAGFRYCPRLSQPYYDNPVRTGIPQMVPLAANLTWQHGSGPTTENWTWPFNTINFTTTVSNLCAIPSGGTHNYYQGTLEGGLNAVPGVVTVTGGTMDSALSPTKLYWAVNKNAGNAPANNTEFRLSGVPGGIGNHYITMNGDATGTMTFTPTPHILPMQPLFDKTVNGYHKYFQGTGTVAADCTVMTQFELSYRVATGLIQTFNTSYVGTAFGGTILDNPAALPVGWDYYDWNPCSVGPIGLSAIGSPGEQGYIGPEMVFTSRHAYNQSFQSEKLMRIAATASAFFGVSTLRDSTLRNYVNVSANTYTGVVAPSTTLQKSFANVNGTFTGASKPPTTTTYFMASQQNHSHEPNMAFWAATTFGDPDFVDLAIEGGIGSLTMWGTSNRNFAAPNAPGTGILVSAASGGAREVTWGLRNLLKGSLNAPRLHPDGSQSCDMLRDHANRQFDYMAAMCNSTQLGSYFNTNGRFCGLKIPASQPAPQMDASWGGFMLGYALNIWPLGVKILGNTNALALLNYEANWLKHVKNTFGGFYNFPEYDAAVLLAYNATAAGPIPDDAHFTIQSNSIGAGATTWVTSGNPYFSVVLANPGRGWVGPVNGDTWMFDTTYGKISATGSSYNSTTGLITIKMANGLTGVKVGGYVALSNLTGTGAFASLNGGWPITVVGNPTTTLTLQGPIGAGASTITGGAAANRLPAGFTGGVPYIVRDAVTSGLTTTFNLALTAGGTVLIPGSPGSATPGNGPGSGFSGPFTMAGLKSWNNPLLGFVPTSGGRAANGYLAVKSAGFNFAKAVGATGYDDIGADGYSLISDATTRLVANATSFVSNPTYLLQNHLV